MIGTILDKYRIIEKVGEGGMASVYRGEHLTLGREVAVKILHPHLSDKARNRQRFSREARAIENLRHDNILRIEDYSGEEARDCYIVTEFVDGPTLQRLQAEQGALPSEVVVLIGLRLADALEYAHALGIIHRDLKPENVMMRRDGTIKLMDFGIARFLDEMHLTMTGALVGSPAYMSPEQAMERVLDSRSDLFSLGTLLFHLVSGQLPFAGSNPSVVLRAIIEGNRPGVADLVPEVSPPLADLIHALLQVDPADRPANAGQVRERLEACLREVDLDPADPQWSLQAWLIDPAGYHERLDEWLSAVLLRKGKERLAARDHLGALQCFNRLLAIDERRGRPNEEVLAIVSGMHGETPKERAHRAWWIGGALLFVCAVALSLLLRPPPAPQPGGPDLGAPPSATRPAEPAAVEALIELPQSEIEPATDPAAEPAPAEPTVPTPPVSSPTARDLTRPPTLSPGTSPAAERRAQGSGAEARRAEAGPAPGRLTVHVPGSWANLYVDGQYMGRTGRLERAIELSPGEHTLTVTNDFALPYEERFTIAAGEVLNLTTPPLRRRPATVRIGAEVPDECRLLVDGKDRGSLGEHGRTLELAEDRAEAEIELACEGSRSRHKVGPLRAGETVRIP